MSKIVSDGGVGRLPIINLTEVVLEINKCLVFVFVFFYILVICFHVTATTCQSLTADHEVLDHLEIKIPCSIGRTLQ